MAVFKFFMSVFHRERQGKYDRGCDAELYIRLLRELDLITCLIQQALPSFSLVTVECTDSFGYFLSTFREVAICLPFSLVSHRSKALFYNDDNFIKENYLPNYP